MAHGTQPKHGFSFKYLNSDKVGVTEDVIRSSRVSTRAVQDKALVCLRLNCICAEFGPYFASGGMRDTAGAGKTSTDRKLWGSYLNLVLCRKFPDVFGQPVWKETFGVYNCCLNRPLTRVPDRFLANLSNVLQHHFCERQKISPALVQKYYEANFEAE